MFYILIIPALVMSSFMVIHLMTIKRHDKALFQFCQLRREIMFLLRRDNFNMPKNDYTSLRDLLEILNINIHYYNTCKTSIFNIRKLSEKLREYQQQSSGIERINRSKNPEIIELYNKFCYTMLFAFLTYTPFIRSEIILSFMIYVTKNKFNFYAEILQSIKNRVHDCRFRSFCNSH